MVNKGATALGVFIATAGVAYFGFDPAIYTNSSSALLSVTLMYSIVPAVLACIALPLLWSYPLTRLRQQRMRQHIEKRNARLQPSHA